MINADSKTKKIIKLNIDKKTIQKKKNLAEKKEHRITVWLHGTKGLGKFSDFMHATPFQGLQHISSLPSKYRLSSVVQTLNESDPIRFPFDTFYIFGWSGKLNFLTRLSEAETLYAALLLIVNDYQKKYDATPAITLITHSHGGNVALNLAHVHDKQKSDLMIDQLILLACPVQHETKFLVEHSFFKKITSLYSNLDLLQIIDPQGMYITQRNPKRHLELSARLFPFHSKLRQAKISINGHGVMHVGFIVKSFAKILPHIITEIEKWQESEEEVLLYIKT